MDNEIKNIVFDMGNVLTVFQQREYIYRYVHNEEDFNWIKKSSVRISGVAVDGQGTVTDDEAIASICERMLRTSAWHSRTVYQRISYGASAKSADGTIGGGIVPKGI